MLEPLAAAIGPGLSSPGRGCSWAAFRDPQVGRDILVGGLLAGVFGLVDWLSKEMTVFADLPLPIPTNSFLEYGLSLEGNLESRLGYAHAAIMSPMGILVLLIIFRAIFRKSWMATLSVLVLFTVLPVLVAAADSKNALELTIITLTSLVFTSATLFVLLRFGLLPAAVAQFIYDSLKLGVTWDLSVWYAGPTLVSVAICILLLVYGFYISLAGRPLLSDDVVNARLFGIQQRTRGRHIKLAMVAY